MGERRVGSKYAGHVATLREVHIKRPRSAPLARRSAIRFSPVRGRKGHGGTTVAKAAQSPLATSAFAPGRHQVAVRAAKYARTNCGA